MTKRDGSTKEDTNRPRVNPMVWFKIFHEPRLLVCLIELVKNGFDWGATTINVITGGGRDKLRIADDGRGMDIRNRMAFLSVGESTAGGDMSGTFGTGTKKVTFTFTSNVRVVTAPEDEPDLVYVCEFTPTELAEVYAGEHNDVIWRSQPKTTKTWPHEQRFGTDITFTLKDPSQRSIHRDAKLARLLSDRLDNVLISSGMVLVNGERLPAKELAKDSRLFSISQPAGVNPALGEVRLEFYRPARKSSSEDLLMTGRSIGEVSFRDFLVKHSLTDEQREMVPPLFLESEVCGLIKADFLNDHVTERRDVYDASISTDERVVELLRLLNRIELDVAAHLGIKLRHLDSEEAQGKEEIRELLDRWQRQFNPRGELPEGYTGRRTKDDDTDTKGVTNRPKAPVSKSPRLSINQEEFALDEIIMVILEVPEGSTKGFRFYHDQARAKLIEKSSEAISLIADEQGRGLIQAVNPRTGQSARVEYDVVLERVFRLSTNYLAVEVGSHTTMRALNTDKVKGKVIWELVEGRGKLEVLQGGRAARFSSDRTGKVTIAAYDSSRKSNRQVCDIRVTPRHDTEPPLRIKDHYFTVDYTVNDLYAYRKPATIVKAGEHDVHRLVFNLMAPGYQAALKAGTLQDVLALATAMEYAKHFSINWDEIDTDDLQSVVLEIQNTGSVIFEEMLGG